MIHISVDEKGLLKEFPGYVGAGSHKGIQGGCGTGACDTLDR